MKASRSEVAESPQGRIVFARLLWESWFCYFGVIGECVQHGDEFVSVIKCKEILSRVRKSRHFAFVCFAGSACVCQHRRLLKGGRVVLEGTAELSFSRQPKG